MARDPEDKKSHAYAVLPRTQLSRDDRRLARQTKTFPVFDTMQCPPERLAGADELARIANADIQDGLQVVTALVVRRR